MKSEWNLLRLGDVCEVNKENYSHNDKWDYINYLDTGNLTENIISEIQYIDVKNETLPSRAKRKVEVNDVLFSTVRPNQKHYGIIKSPVKNMIASTGFVVMSGKQNQLANQFLYYYLSQDSIVSFLQTLAESCTSTYPSIKPTHIENLSIKLPNYSEQKAIAATLSCLDDKIELNNRINKSLEVMAQEIFKSWFVDFEPFQEGEFVDSELGMIPKGWRVETIGKLCKSISKKHDFKKPDLVFLNTGDVLNGEFMHNTFSNIKFMPGQAKKSITKDDILYSEIRPINRHFAYVGFDAKDYVVSTKLMVLRSLAINPRRLYHYLTLPSVILELQQEAESRSGTFPQIRFDNLRNLRLIISTDDIEKEFSQILETVYSIIDKNILENRKLSSLRDTLLPKLMSGEIRVPIQEE